MTKIPKIIHWCWFGKEDWKKFDIIKKCVESWYKICPDYEFILWNEDNCDLDECKFVRTAYEIKKYAFCSDYFRLVALNEIGGIYLDTDTMLVKSLEKFMNLESFISFLPSKVHISLGLIGNSGKNELFDDCIQYYKTNDLDIKNSSTDKQANTTIMEKFLNEKYNFVPNGKFQKCGKMVFSPYYYFCSDYDKVHNKCEITERTYAVHHSMLSWKKW
jgi:mannosyltransferase OCH1-like enzyme